jgi:transcriptional regulator GlxA family with amidase domain
MKKIGRTQFIVSIAALSVGVMLSVHDVASKNKQNRTMKRQVAILIFDEAEVLDFAGPFEVFSVTSQLNNFEPFRVFTIAERTSPIEAVNGLKVIPDFSIDDHPAIDILIIAGGQGTRKLLGNEKLLQWLKEVHATTLLTLSICSGARLLGALGLLDGKPFCTHHEVYDHIKEIAPQGIPQKDKRFVQTSATVYTSGGISAGIDLSFHIVEKLLGKEVAERTATYMEYNRQF